MILNHYKMFGAFLTIRDLVLLEGGPLGISAVGRAFAAVVKGKAGDKNARARVRCPGRRKERKS